MFVFCFIQRWRCGLIMALRAAGLVIFRRFHEKLEYLLMQTSYGSHHWTPPKGHVDPGESDEETAFRETEEEAGLKRDDLIFYPDFQQILQYKVKNEDKSVIYWLAEMKNPEMPITMSDEHQDYKWLELKEACKFAAYTDMQKVLTEAEIFIKSKNNT